MKAPVGSLRYRKIHMTPGWKIQTGADIGGVAPAKYSFQQGMPFQPNAALLSVVGIAGKYCDWLAGGKSFPIVNCAQNYLLNHRFMVDVNFATAAQARELDTKFVGPNSEIYNGSTQMSLSAEKGKMHFQIDKASKDGVSGGGWVDTGIVLPLFTPGVEHEEQIQYSIDFTKKTYSVEAYELDGVTYTVPDSFNGVPLQNLPATKSNWTPNIILPQLQQDVNPTGGGWQWQVLDLNYDLW